MMNDLGKLSAEEQKKALAWQCRRGLKEIEVILVPFLEQYFLNESQEVRLAFIALLEEQDIDIFEWLMQRHKPEDSQKEWIINVILERMGA